MITVLIKTTLLMKRRIFLCANWANIKRGGGVIPQLFLIEKMFYIHIQSSTYSSLGYIVTCLFSRQVFHSVYIGTIPRFVAGKKLDILDNSQYLSSFHAV